MIRELAPAKVNLLLHVGPRRGDGLHELCSLVASVELADELTIEEAAPGADAVAPGGGAPAAPARDAVACEGVEGPNLAESALAAFRSLTGAPLPPLRVTIAKRIPVAAGLGGGSADAAAVLRAANELAGRPRDPAGLRELGARIGADVPSQVEPRHVLVTGAGEGVEPLAELAPMALLLLPREEGLATRAVYAEADRIGATRVRLDPDRARALAAAPLEELAAALENDLQAAVLSLRPELAEPLAAVRGAGALAALVTGAGPTVVGVFADRAAARRAAALFSGSIVTVPRAS